MSFDFELVDLFKKLGENNQILASVHSPILMEGIGQVYSLAHRKWMPADKFIQSQRKGKHGKSLSG